MTLLRFFYIMAVVAEKTGVLWGKTYSGNKEVYMYTLEDIQAVDMEVAQAITDEV